MIHPSSYSVDHSGYWVTSNLDPGNPRTYACLGEKGLQALIEHLTGRDVESYPLDSRNLPYVPGITIAFPLHVYIEEPLREAGS